MARLLEELQVKLRPQIDAQARQEVKSLFDELKKGYDVSISTSGAEDSIGKLVDDVDLLSDTLDGELSIGDLDTGDAIKDIDILADRADELGDSFKGDYAVEVDASPARDELERLQETAAETGKTLVLDKQDYDLDYSKSRDEVDSLTSKVSQLKSELESARKEGEKPIDSGFEKELTQAEAKAKELRFEVAKVIAEGKTGDEAFGKITAELKDAEKEAKKLKDALDEASEIGGSAGESISSGFGSIGTVAAGVGIGAIAAEGFTKAVDAALEYTKALEANKKLTQQLTGLTGDALNEQTALITSTASTFDKEYNEVLRSANTLSKAFGIDLQESLDLINEGFIAGADANGDFLDKLAEYPDQFAAAGLTASETIALMSQTPQEGIFSDKGEDTIKESLLRIREMPQATADAIDALGISSAQLKEDIDAGVITTFDALQLITDKMGELPETSTAVGTAVADIFGGAGEDASLRFLTNLSNIDLELENLKESQEGYAQAQRAQLEATQKLDQALTKLYDGAGTAVGPLLTKLKEFAALGIDALSDLKDELKAVFESIDPSALDLLKAIGAVIGVTILGAVKVVKEAFVTSWEIIISLLNRIGQAFEPLIDYFQKLIGGAEGGGDAMAFFSKAIEGTFDVIGAFADILIEIVGFALDTVVQGIVKLAEGIEWLVEKIVGGFDAIASFLGFGDDEPQAAKSVKAVTSAVEELNETELEPKEVEIKTKAEYEIKAPGPSAEELKKRNEELKKLAERYAKVGEFIENSQAFREGSQNVAVSSAIEQQVERLERDYEILQETRERNIDLMEDSLEREYSVLEKNNASITELQQFRNEREQEIYDERSSYIQDSYEKELEIIESKRIKANTVLEIAYEESQDALQKSFDEQFEAAEGNAQLTEELQREYQERQKLLKEEFLESQALITEEYDNEGMDAYREFLQEREDLEIEYTDKKIERDQALREAELDAETKQMQARMALVNDFAKLLEQAGDKNIALTKAAFLLQKGVAVAEIITNAQQEIALLGAQLGIAAPPFQAIATARAAVGVATVLAQTVAGFNQGGPTGTEPNRLIMVNDGKGPRKEEMVMRAEAFDASRDDLIKMNRDALSIEEHITRNRPDIIRNIINKHISESRVTERVDDIRTEKIEMVSAEEITRSIRSELDRIEFVSSRDILSNIEKMPINPIDAVLTQASLKGGALYEANQYFRKVESEKHIYSHAMDYINGDKIERLETAINTLASRLPKKITSIEEQIIRLTINKDGTGIIENDPRVELEL